MLRLVAWERLTAAEAAVVLGCSRATFTMRLMRARRRLRAQLDGSVPTRGRRHGSRRRCRMGGDEDEGS
ncbi:sigma factor-like helix-turn-helix DNA-binding protein [Salinispora pacifica]|uniref:sigma factor-like helix-turn-helix DNA-binding protein n=1 Tax=Salinispora pacifica TaxID=351187 RepID=UPI001EE198EE|nr:sigma factor-like helix-turn-helix DNA-binding protein [Salinispora pacifica]